MLSNIIKMAFMLLTTTIVFFAASPVCNAVQQWNYVNPPESISNDTVPIIAMSPNFVNDNTIFMTTGWGLYESKDGGKNWNDPHSHKISRANNTPNRFYGAGSTTKKPTARIYVPHDFNDSGLLVLSDTSGCYVADLSPGKYVQFMSIRPPLKYISIPGYRGRGILCFNFLQGFAFGPDGTLYAASGFQIFSCSSSQINPADGRCKWKELSYVGDFTYNIKLSPNFSNDQTIIIQTVRNVLISTDGGKNFTQTNLPTTDGYYDIEFSPNYASDGTIAAVVPDIGLFLSTNKGISWENVFPSKGITATSIGPSGAIYAGSDYTYDEENGAYVSYDKGQKWQKIGLEGSKITSLFVFKATDGDLVYAGTDSNLAWTIVAQSDQSVSEPMAPAASYDPTSIRFVIGQNSCIVDGKIVQMDTVPFIENGQTYIPVRYIANAFGVPDSGITWDDVSQTVTLSDDKKMLKMVIGSNKLTINGKDTIMDASPIMKDDRFFSPARFVVTAFNCIVTLDEQNQAIVISK